MNKVDLQEIADTLEFDLEDVEMLIEVFLESADESLTILSNGIENKDFKLIFESAHALKGSAANLTLIEISDTAKKIESEARDLNEIDYEKLYIKLSSLIKSIR